MKTSDFDFELPNELIASHPLPERDTSRMLVVNGSSCPTPSLAEGVGGVGLRAGGRVQSKYQNQPHHQEYARHIKTFARNMRKEPTDAENKFWQAVRNKQLGGFTFRRQQQFDNKYIADFVCYDKKLIVEIDGSQHIDNRGDQIRTEYLQQFGFNVVRFFNWDIKENLGSCLEIVHDILNNDSFEKRLEEFEKNLPNMRVDNKGNVFINPPPGARDSTADPLRKGGGEANAECSPNTVDVSPPIGKGGGEASAECSPNTVDVSPPIGKGGGEVNAECSPSILQDRHIRDFLDFLRPGDVVVFNNSKVIPARFDATASDGTVYEITLHTVHADQPLPCGGVDDEVVGGGFNNKWYGLSKKFNKLRIGDELTLADNETKIIIRDVHPESGLLIEFQSNQQSAPGLRRGDGNQQSIFSILEKIGKMPLPPYMNRKDAPDDRERYQTVYADPLGSMAAPTAGLHFTPEMLREIENRGAKIVNITLHVGAGTWMPVKTEDLSQHKMHSEWGEITMAQVAVINSAKRVIAIGTTSLRLLESAAVNSPSRAEKSATESTSCLTPALAAGVGRESDRGVGSLKSSISDPPPGVHTGTADPRRKGGGERVQPFSGTTDIFITPGYKFKVVDVLLTNFHLPKSTLFMLVSAFAGVPEMRDAYAHAIAEKYRFFSYGDCCLLFKKES